MEDLDFFSECRMRILSDIIKYRTQDLVTFTRVFIRDKKQRGDKKAEAEFVSRLGIVRNNKLSPDFKRWLAVGVVRKAPTEILKIVLWMIFNDFKIY